jgi:hypothetical protein
MNRIKVTPTDPDAVMYDPLTGRRLPPEGMVVEQSSFWIRRELAHEVSITEPDDEGERASSPPTGREPLTPRTTR